MKKIALSCQEGSSDKVYQCGIAGSEEMGYRVEYAFGRRGAALKTGVKNSAPLPLPAAIRLYDETVKEKFSKGYREENGGVSGYQQPDAVGAVSGFLPQLLNPVAGAELDFHLDSPEFCAQEKKDGERLILISLGGVVSASNRRGLLRGLSEVILKTAQAIKEDFVFDGEVVGDTFYVFDVLQWKGRDLRSENLLFRLERMRAIVRETGLPPGAIVFLPTAFSSPSRRFLFAKLEKEGAEGIVFKRLSSAYAPGRPAGGGDHLKYKFYETASFRVAEINVRRSVGLSLLDKSGAWIPVGNATIPPNHSVPALNAVVEVRYLHAFPGGSIYQPTYLGLRSDVSVEECGFGQLKFKAIEDRTICQP